MIELMVTVVVFALLVAIAFPSYQVHITRSRRSNAKTALHTFATAMQRYQTTYGTYAESCQGNCSSEKKPPKSDVFTDKAPLEGNSHYYNLFMTVTDADTYTLFAIPVGAQQGDGCLSVDSDAKEIHWENDDCTGFTKEWEK